LVSNSLSLFIDSLGMRWMLGMFEAGLFPGVNYYLSWYVVLSSQPLLLSMDAIAGTNARSLVSAPPCSSPQLQSLVHSAVYLRSAYRDPSSFSGNIDFDHSRLRYRRWKASGENQLGHGFSVRYSNDTVKAMNLYRMS
jgi:hypothetical protein